jgi:hypothetical protein
MFARLTAASLCGLPVPQHPSIQASVQPGVRRPRIDGIDLSVGARAPGDAWLLDGRRVSAGPRTFLDCACQLTRSDLVCLGDAMLNRGWTTLDALAQRIKSAAGARGVAIAREALPLLEPRAASPGETRSRLILIEKKFPRPLAGVVIYDAAGEWVAEVDLLVRDPPVVLQYDGEYHFRTDAQRRSDAIRDEVVADLGYQVVVLTGRDIRDPDRLERRAHCAFARAEGTRARGHIAQPARRVCKIPPKLAS